MKQQYIHLNFLIFSNASLSHRALYETNGNHKNESHSLAEKLEQSGRHGLLNEMFNEIIGSDSTLYFKMFIRGIYTGKSYQLIDLAVTPFVMDSFYSTDPYLFLSESNLNS